MYRHEEGQAILEMAIVIPLLALLLATVVAFGPLIHMKLATQQAAYDCALAAAQSLDAQQGAFQGRQAAEQSFAAFNLKRGGMAVQVQGDWSRVGNISCSVVYQIPTGAYPFHGIVSLPSSVSHFVTLPPQTLKSEWR